MSRWPSLRLRSLKRAGHRARSRRRGLFLERLEERFTPASIAPVAVDDSVSAFVDSSGGIDIDALANDHGTRITTFPALVSVVEPPVNGSVLISRKSSSPSLVAAFPSPLGDELARAIGGVVDSDGRIDFEYVPFVQSTWAPPQDLGDFAVFVRLGVSDLTDFDPSIYDIRLTVRPQDTRYDKLKTTFNVVGLPPGTPFIAWTDNTIDPNLPHTDTSTLHLLSPTVIRYLPNAGFRGTDTFTYQVAGENGGVSNVATVSVTVLDRPPDAVDDTARTKSNTPVVIHSLFNDVDFDSDLASSSLMVETAPQHGVAAVEPGDFGPVIRYLPAAGFTGDDLFTYTVRDDEGVVSNIATVSVFVGNLTPQADDTSVATSPGVPLTIFLIGNESDPDSQPEDLSILLGSLPAHGTATVEEFEFGSWVTYLPAAGFEGTDSFVYTLRDAEGAQSNPATVTIAVQGVPNLSPQAVDNADSTTEGMSLAVDVLADDFDFDGTIDLSTLTLTTLPSRGAAAIQQTPSGPIILYTPAAATGPALVVDEAADVDDGDYSPGHLTLREAIKLANADGYTAEFRYTVRDNSGAPSNEATVRIAVQPSPTLITFAPTLTASPLTLSLSRVGDTAEDNSAFAITSPITIVGPSGPNRITLVGQGIDSDLRAFLVAARGDLTLQNLTFAHWGTDDSGGVLNVQAGGSAHLENCVLEGNFAFAKGAAIYNLGTTTLANSKIAGSRSDQGGAIANFGQLQLTGTALSGNSAHLGGGLYNLGTLTTDASTFIDNRADHSGGGLYNHFGGHATITNSSFRGNHATRGGGFFTSGRLELSGSTLADNSADTGGGFENAEAGSVGLGTNVFGESRADLSRAGIVSLSDSHVSNNVARQGGGIRNLGIVTATRTTVSNNRADQGGAIYHTNHGASVGASTLDVIASTISANRAASGAGLYIDQGIATLTDSTVKNNAAVDSGGGIFNNGTLRLMNTTLAGNSARFGGAVNNEFGSSTLTSSTISTNSAPLGGGLYNKYGYVVLTSSIVAGNAFHSAPSDIGGLTPVDKGLSIHNLIGKGGSGGLKSGVNRNLVGIDPLLAPLHDYGGPVQTMALLPGSPAIDAGTGDNPDARGIGPVGQRDIGAFESQGFTLTVSRGDGQATQRSRAFKHPLQVTVSPVASGEPVTGGAVSFSASRSGVSAQLSNARVNIGANRSASVTARANSKAGTYHVIADMAGAQLPVVFTLRNLRPGQSPSARVMLAPTTGVRAPASPPLTPASVAAQAQNSSASRAGQPAYSTLPADRTEYRLTAGHTLQQRVLGFPWSELQKNVLEFKKAPNGDLYLLNDQHELWRLKLGYSRTLLQADVQTFALDAYGTLYTQDRLNRGWTYWSLDRYFVLPAIPTGLEPIGVDSPSDLEVIQAVAVSSGNDLFAHQDEGNDAQLFSPGPDFPLSRELAIILDASGQTLSPNVPSLRNLPAREQNVRSPFNNVRIVKEKVVDALDPPRLYPGVGLAQLHRVQYRCEIYSSIHPTSAAFINEDAQYIVFIDHSHLHKYEAGSIQSTPIPVDRDDTTGNQLQIVSSEAGLESVISTLANDLNALSSSANTGVATMPGPATQRYRGNDNLMQSLVQTADGTITVTGRYGGDGWLQTGTEIGPYQLTRLSGNSLWDPLFQVYSSATAPDGTLYALLSSRELKVLPARSAQTMTLATHVQSFQMKPDGKLLVLGTNHELRTFSPAKQQWSVLQAGVLAFTMTPDGTIWALNDRQELKRLSTQGSWAVVDQGVQSFAMVEGGAIYELNGQGQLKRLQGSASAVVLHEGVQEFQVAQNGNVYALTRQHELKRLTARDHWTVLDPAVLQFKVSPNGDLYLINDQHELRRQKVGYSWMTLQEDAQSFKLYSDGTVHVLDSQAATTMYSSQIGAYILLGPVGGDFDPHEALDPPSDDEVVNAANIRPVAIQYFSPGPEFLLTREAATLHASASLMDGMYAASGASARTPPLLFNSAEFPIPEMRTVFGITGLFKDKILDVIDPPRFVPDIGMAQLHRAQYRCTITFDTLDGGTGEMVIYLDHDHYHLAGTTE